MGLDAQDRCWKVLSHYSQGHIAETRGAQSRLVLPTSRLASTFAIGIPERVLLLKVIRPFCLNLSCALVYGKAISVGTAEAIGKRIAAISSLMDRYGDVPTRRVLSYRASQQIQT